MENKNYKVTINKRGSIEEGITFTVDSNAMFEMDGQTFKFADITHVGVSEIQENQKDINPADYFLYSKGSKKR